MRSRERDTRAAELELEVLKRIVGRLEHLSAPGDTEVRELQRLLLLLEWARLPPSETGVDWGRLLPLLLSLGVTLAAIVAALLGVDMRGAF